MTIWLDAQLPPAIAAWIQSRFGVPARPVRDIGLRDAKDSAIFQAARMSGAVVMTKDEGFVEMLKRFGPPPSVLWVTCGNTSNVRLREILLAALPAAIVRLDGGESLVEITEVV
jgi:predicted nuclease of predicted toxin-antitoxin system